jgi:hypothetical protein
MNNAALSKRGIIAKSTIKIQTNNSEKGHFSPEKRLENCST